MEDAIDKFSKFDPSFLIVDYHRFMNRLACIPELCTYEYLEFLGQHLPESIDTPEGQENKLLAFSFKILTTDVVFGPHFGAGFNTSAHCVPIIQIGQSGMARDTKFIHLDCRSVGPCRPYLFSCRQRLIFRRRQFIGDCINIAPLQKDGSKFGTAQCRQIPSMCSAYCRYPSTCSLRMSHGDSHR